MHELYKSEHEKILEERLIQITEKILDLERWEFKFSYKSFVNGYVAIYDSPSCRLLCSLSHDPRDKNDSITLNYGRSHAPNDNHYMVYQGENCHAWHSFIKDYIGQFLDGVNPRTLARARIDRKNISSRAREAFEKSKTNEELSSPIWSLRLTAFTWEYYGNSLFKLFDMSYPETWKEYRYFLSEYYGELSKEPNWRGLFVDQPKWKPLPWQVC